MCGIESEREVPFLPAKARLGAPCQSTQFAVLRLSSITRAPCLKVMAALGHRSQAARKDANAIWKSRPLSAFRPFKITGPSPANHHAADHVPPQAAPEPAPAPPTPRHSATPPQPTATPTADARAAPRPRWRGADDEPCATSWYVTTTLSMSPYSFDLAAHRLALGARPVQKPFACRDQCTATHHIDVGA